MAAPGYGIVPMAPLGYGSPWLRRAVNSSTQERLRSASLWTNRSA